MRTTSTSLFFRTYHVYCVSDTEKKVSKSVVSLAIVLNSLLFYELRVVSALAKEICLSWKGIRPLHMEKYIHPVNLTHYMWSNLIRALLYHYLNYEKYTSKHAMPLFCHLWNLFVMVGFADICSYSLSSLKCVTLHLRNRSNWSCIFNAEGVYFEFCFSGHIAR